MGKDVLYIADRHKKEFTYPIHNHSVYELNFVENAVHTGRNISEYIIDLRLGYAARMLVDTAKSISEIGFDCGFNNLSNFNRIFKKKKGCSPSEFRENYHKTRIII